MNVFFSYSPKDEGLRDELEVHLALLKRQGKISVWHDRQITAGKVRADEIDQNLERADIILLLVSPPFVASDYCWEVEVQRAMERHEAGEARVIPIVLRRVDWSSAPFGKLQALPRDARPVANWPDRDEAFYNVAEGLRAVIEDIGRQPSSSPPASPADGPAAGAAAAAAPAAGRGAVALWREMLDHLLEAEPLTTDPAQRFALKKQIEEARAKIRELER